MQTAVDSRPPIGGKVILGWGLGSLGLATVLNTFNVLLIAYLTLVVGLEPALAGGLILIAKVYDVLTDLPMGWLTDRTRSAWGARRPYLLAAAIVTPAAMILVFSAPTGNAAVYVVCALLLYATGYTLFNVPYLSMPAELTDSVHLRTRMVAFRSAFIAVGTFFGIAVAPFLVGSLGGGQRAYMALGLVTAVVVFAAFLACFAMTGVAAHAEAGRSFPPLREQLGVVLADRHFRSLMMIKVTHLLAVAVSAGGLVFFFRFALGHDLRMLGIYGAVTTGVWVLAMPFWSALARRRGKRFGYLVATAGQVLFTCSWLFAEAPEPVLLVIARAAGFGVIAGGMLLMGNAMLQDVMDLDYRLTGRRKNGMFAGMYSLVEKITSGIGAQILGIVLSLTGFDRKASIQTEAAVLGTYIAVALIPAALMLLSLVIIYNYRLDESELQRTPAR